MVVRHLQRDFPACLSGRSGCVRSQAITRIALGDTAGAAGYSCYDPPIVNAGY